MKQLHKSILWIIAIYNFVIQHFSWPSLFLFVSLSLSLSLSLSFSLSSATTVECIWKSLFCCTSSEPWWVSWCVLSSRWFTAQIECAPSRLIRLSQTVTVPLHLTCTSIQGWWRFLTKGPRYLHFGGTLPGKHDSTASGKQTGPGRDWGGNGNGYGEDLFQWHSGENGTVVRCCKCVKGV